MLTSGCGGHQLQKFNLQVKESVTRRTYMILRETVNTLSSLACEARASITVGVALKHRKRGRGTRRRHIRWLSRRVRTVMTSCPSLSPTCVVMVQRRHDYKSIRVNAVHWEPIFRAQARHSTMCEPFKDFVSIFYPKPCD